MNDVADYDESADVHTKLPTWLGFAVAFVLLVGLPGFFTSGYVLRGFVWSLALLITTSIVAFRLLPSHGSCCRQFWLAFPILVALLGLLAGPQSAAAAIRHGYVWIALAIQAWLLLQLIRRDLHAAAVMRIWMLAGVVAAAWIFSDGIRGRSPVGPFGRPGVAGVVIASFMPWAMAFAPGRQLTRALFLLPLLLALIATGSRTAWLATCIGFVVLLFAMAAPSLRKRLRLPVLGFGVAVGVLATLAFLHKIPVPGDTDTLDVRTGLARASSRLISEAPVTGHGLGSFAPEVLRVRDLNEARLETGRRPTHAHNDYMHVATEGGVLAGLALVLFVVIALIRFLQAVDGAKSPGGRLIRVASTGSFAALAAAALSEGVFIDPAPALCAAVAIGLGTRNPDREMDCPFPPRLLWLGTAAAMFFVGWHLQRDMVSDRYVMLARQTGGPHDDDTLSKDYADIERRRIARADQALAARNDNAEAHYIRGVSFARIAELDKANAAFRRATQFDSGRTEARLDRSEVLSILGRREDAKNVLREAREHDPTRFDVAIRLAHLELGPEPVPGDPPEANPSADVLMAYNRARALAPERFENLVADARQLRRSGGKENVEKAGGRLREALKRLGVESPDAPTEIVVESFRLAETEGRASEPMLAGILQLGLEKDRRVCGSIEREATRFLDIGEARIEAARKEVSIERPKLDTQGADRAFRAATIRLAALSLAGWFHPDRVASRATELSKERRFRRSVAWWRALLVLTTITDDRGQSVVPSAKRADWLISAAKAAARFDAKLARNYFHQGHMLLGAEMLAAKQWQQAERLLAKVVEEDPTNGGARLALAKALIGLNKKGAAGDHVVRALTESPDLRETARVDPAFESLRGRSDIDVLFQEPKDESK